MKAFGWDDGGWEQPFLRPTIHGTEIGADGLVNSPMIYVYNDKDWKWKITQEGTYKLTFNLKKWYLTVTPLK